MGILKLDSMRVLKMTTASLFFGWAIVHLFWDVPYRELLWSEWLFKPTLEFFGGHWQSYLTNIENDRHIQWGIQAVGVFLLTLSAFVLTNFREKSGRLLFAGSFILLTVFLMQFKESGFKVGLLLEQTAQFSAPILLYALLFQSSKNFVLLVKAAIAITFLAHGLFAIGILSVPGNFIDMIINMFGVSEATARTLLFYMGFADVLLALTIFIPEFEIPILFYGVFWGLATALARPVSFVGSGGGEESVIFWLAQTLLRAPHFGLPLFLLFYRREHPLETKTYSPVTNTLSSEVG